MPLSLVIGPANAEKARVVLDAYEAHARAGREPLLVVPTAADLDVYRREVAERGLVFGAQVLTASGLQREVARRAGVRGRALGKLARERVAAAAIASLAEPRSPGEPGAAPDEPAGGGLDAAGAGGGTLRVLGAAAATAGFPGALLALVDELEALRVDPARWWVAVRAWGVAEPARAGYAEDLGALYAAYERVRERLGRPDPAQHAVAALDVLREQPRRWGDTPVLLYGFDDLTPLQQDLVETLATRVGAEVTLSLPYEPGRVALAGVAGTYETLRQLAAAPAVQLPASPEHYEHPALHHLERHLFEPVATPPSDAAASTPAGCVRAGGATGGPDAGTTAAGSAGAGGAPGGPYAGTTAAGSNTSPSGADAGAVAPGTVPAGDGVLLLVGGGERAELELVGAHVARLLREDHAPEDVAVALRRPEQLAPLVERVFSAYGIPHALQRRVPAGHTGLGGGLCALLRAALLDGSADDLLRYLRTPGLLRRPELSDDLEAAARRDGLRTAAEARTRWEADGRFPLDVLDRCAAAWQRGPRALYDWLSGEAGRLLAAPFAGQAHVFDAPEAAEAAVASEVRGALAELSGLARQAARAEPSTTLKGPGTSQVTRTAPVSSGLLPDPAQLERLLADLPVRVGRRPGPGLVTVADPLALRARRFRTLAIAGLQEGSFPAPARPDALLGDAERRALNSASGLRLALEPDRLAGERARFYEAVSRPTRRLVLSWHDADEDGKPQARSPFVDDVLDLVGAPRTERRALGAAGWEDPTLAPTAREAARAAAARAEVRADEHIAPLTDPAVLTPLAERQEWSASALEAWTACPVRWFVERHLRPGELVPDPEPLVRGRLAHEVLEHALQDRLEHAPRPLRPADLPALRVRTQEALERLAGDHRISAVPERGRAALRRLEVDLVAYLEWAAHAGSDYGPAHLEVAFGTGTGRPAVTVGQGEKRLTLRGRIDRVDLGRDAEGAPAALLYDYKGRTAAPQARWVRDGKLQLALYLLAVPHLLGLDAVGGLYQPLGNPDDPRPRGLLADGEDAALPSTKTDRVDPDAFTRVLDGALDAALKAVAELRAGRLQPRPASCGWKDGGCTYPAICRAEGL